MNPVAAVQSATAAAALTALLYTALPTRIAAQQPRRVTIGDRIRVEATAESGKRFGPTVGTFHGTTADSLYLGVPRYIGGRLLDSLIAIHWPSVQRLEVSVGHRNARTGSIVGGLLGAALGATGGIVCCGGGWYRVRASLWYGAAFGAAGAGAGAMLGLAIPGTGPWVPAEIPATRLGGGDTVTASSPARVTPEGLPRSTIRPATVR